MFFISLKRLLSLSLTLFLPVNTLITMGCVGPTQFCATLLDGTTDLDGKIVAINRGQLVPGTKVVVNLYDGGERDIVNIALDGSEFVSMLNVLRNDPFMVRQHAKYKGTPDAFSSPEPSSHIWEYELPANLASGLHKVVVKSRDEFGQEAEQSFSFELLN